MLNNAILGREEQRYNFITSGSRSITIVLKAAIEIPQKNGTEEQK